MCTAKFNTAKLEYVTSKTDIETLQISMLQKEEDVNNKAIICKL